MAQDTLVEIQHHLFKRQPQDISKMTRQKDTKWRQKGKTSKYFPIIQHRFITDKHPCVLASGKKGQKVRLTLTLNEKRMLEGLTNMFATTENQAIRITLWEMYEQVKEQPECLEEARANPKTTRKNSKTLTIPHAEVERFRQFGCLWEATDAEVIRTAIIYVSKAIRDGVIKKLTDSRKRTQDELALEWSAEQPKDRKGTLQAARDAREKVYEEGRQAIQEKWERSYQEYQDIGDELQRMRWEGIGKGMDDAALADLARARLDIHADEAHQKFMEEQTKEFGKQGALINYWEFNLGMSHKQAVQLAKQQIADEKEEEDTLTDDELADILSGDWLKNEFYGDD